MQFLVSTLVVIIVFISILFLAYVTTKYIGGKTKSSMSGKNIKVVESLNLSLDKQLHLVKVGDKAVLLATAGKNIQLLTTLEANSLEEQETQNEVSAFQIKNKFDKYLQNFLVKKPEEQVKGRERVASNKEESSEVLKNNISKLRSITAKLEENSTKDGDEHTNEK